MGASGVRRRRVAVTGLGCLTPLGGDVESSWRALLDGRSGVAALDSGFDPRLGVRIAARVRAPIDPSELGPKDRRRLDRVVRLALAAADQALADAGAPDLRVDANRTGVAVGTGIGGITTLLANHVAYREGGPRRVSPFFVPMTLGNMAAGAVAIRHGLRGPNLCPVAACASGAQALGQAARLVERGDADVMLAGGSEACVNDLVLAGFDRMQALSRRADAPERASRPFDLDRDGFVMGEGAAILVLEADDHARARGARIRAWLSGFAATDDALHVAAPDEEGVSAEHCMALALQDASVSASELDYLNAHATSTPAGDRAEARAVRRLFGSHAERLPVSSTKGATGHLLGAAGAVEAIFCTRALETGTLPPTINLDRPDPDCALDHVAHKPRQVRACVAMSNSFGFGGVNTALVLQRGDT